MHRSAFFRFFPPPKFMHMKHVGLHISDDSIHCIEFLAGRGAPKIVKYGKVDLPEKIVEGGEILDSSRLKEILIDFDKKYDISYAKVAVPEEKAYLFQTDVTSNDVRAIAQNIEFKLEQNVPLTAQDAVFYFDLLPKTVDGSLRASVSVVSKAYIQQLDSILKESGILPVGFEVLPKAVSRAAIPDHMGGATMLVYVKKSKVGIYILVGNIVFFSSTFKVSADVDLQKDPSILTKEILRIYTYWSSHENAGASITGMILAGSRALSMESFLKNSLQDLNINISVADVWANVFDINKHTPNIGRAESLDYVAAIGLAME